MTPAEIQDPLIDQWIDYKLHNQGRSETTAYKYRLALTRLKLWLIEQDLTCSPPPRSCWSSIAGWCSTSAGKRPRVAPRWSRPSGVLRMGCALRVGPQDPAKHIPVPESRDVPAAPRATPARRENFMQPDPKTFKGLRDAAMLSVLIGTGCRVSGLVRMNESDLLWVNTPNDTERLAVIRFTEKGKAERTVPAPLETGPLIRGLSRS